MDKDKAATWMGCLMAVLMAAQVDFDKLAQGDVPNIIKAGVAVAWLAFGYITNKL